MTITIPAWKNFLYVEVFKIVQRRKGAVYKTKRVGFAPATRPRRADEVYSPISVSRHAINTNTMITFNLIDD